MNLIRGTKAETFSGTVVQAFHNPQNIVVPNLSEVDPLGQIAREFDFLIKCLKQLRDEKYFESVYPERILINFEVWEYYNEDEMMRIFEELNTKEEAKLFSRFLYG